MHCFEKSKMLLYVDCGLSNQVVLKSRVYHFINSPASLQCLCSLLCVYLLSFAVIPGSALSNMALIRDRVKTLVNSYPKTKGRPWEHSPVHFS